MGTRRSLYALIAAAVVVGLGWTSPGRAADSRDVAVLDSAVKDLGLGLFARPDEMSLRLPLTRERWSFFGRVQPYASLGPRASVLAEEATGLTAPVREMDTLSKGIEVGAGLSWHFSDRLELFGEYQLLNMFGRGGQAEVPLGRRDVDNPALRGGFSIRF